jgi:hypothetical protein
MINIHFNGDLIRCPDIAAIKQRMQDSRNKLKICEFGVSEDECNIWQMYQMTHPKETMNIKNKRCVLCRQHETKLNDDGTIKKKIYLCDKAQTRYNAAKSKKHFTIDNNNYRKVASAAHYLLRTSKARTLFLLLTFPQWKADFNPYKNESKLNECFSKFVENLRAHYGCEGYIAVRELGKNTRRYHYHLLCSIPFIPLPVLNSAWCSAISDICETSQNALMSKKENRLITRDKPAAAVRYVCKYISKCKNQASKTRVIFISNNLFRKPVPVRLYENMLERRTGERSLEDYLLKFKSLSTVKINDYCTAFRINNNDDFDKFCDEIMYPMFNFEDKTNINLYAYPAVEPN